MFDFNRRKKILRKLSDTAEKNVLLLLPCLAAAGLVKFSILLYAIWTLLFPIRTEISSE